MRKIVHIDMDAFYASVEQRDFPELRGNPVAVGGGSGRGVVAAASYEARKFGVRSAMPTTLALKKCPQLIVVKPRFEVYRQVSLQIRAIFKEYTDLVEPLSLDEAYLDVTQNHKNQEIATDIALEIKEKIFRTTSLTASAGVSYNKFLAKMASDVNKPNGIFVIPPSQALAFIELLPIEKFYGIGKVTSEKMKNLGIFTGADLRKQSQEKLFEHFGKMGLFYFQVAQGEDNRPVQAAQQRKSVSVEDTFASDLSLFDEMEKEVDVLVNNLWEWVESKKMYGRTATLKMKFNDFTIITRSKSYSRPINKLALFRNTCSELLRGGFNPEKPVRLLGVSLSNFVYDSPTQLEIDFDY